ncbi:TetR/AcrR family transcriptional regulator [Streptomyces sp. HU2014]|uniref:TetR family transcriptional regulator n=1 Tax=Streptomyces albireticuli TaxID=1940 RepID=A0A1Z2L9J7_9ACTN|nr:MULTISPECIES: TetR/AcrR family transcriptional regulator [Streptomyces]ARZ70898.1 TetR family transcriptional regulator [Streptomyces albireticuli]UQI44363.1 TetR/AcrR family transcriptional regulator [Streptomyces sp. HU2014]
MAASGRTARPEVIWARPERAGRGPRPAHTRAEIAAAAVRVADAEGLDGVSMRRVAAEIGCGTMSLYNYVPRKDELYELMVDAVVADYDLSREPSGDWRADLKALAGQTRALMHRHPWVPRLMSPVYGFSPNALRYFEYALWVMEPLDVESGTKVELLAMLNGVITTYVSNELSTAERARNSPYPPGEEEAVRAAYLMRVLSEGEYPRMARTLTSGPGVIDLDEVFARAIDRILDGFEAESRRGG